MAQAFEQGHDANQAVDMESIAHPPIVSREEWLAERRELLQEEKAHTKAYDRLNARRRRLPMVRLDKDYSFEGPEGQQSLRDLFQGKRQLVVYHFMFDPAWDKGCSGCTGFVDALGDLSLLDEKDTRFVLISRAPLDKLEQYRSERGWDWPWYSSFGSDFNYDFNATLDEDIRQPSYNFRTPEETEAHRGPNPIKGESHGISVFFELDGVVYHTYSVYARGVENMTDSYSLLDITPWGRQQDFEDSPPGWPQKPTYG
ncbi:DUF899 domain-containing protein [bacterium]|nr:DUF899 domain-containing protein [bacterium]